MPAVGGGRRGARASVAGAQDAGLAEAAREALPVEVLQEGLGAAPPGLQKVAIVGERDLWALRERSDFVALSRKLLDELFPDGGLHIVNTSGPAMLRGVTVVY